MFKFQREREDMLAKERSALIEERKAKDQELRKAEELRKTLIRENKERERQLKQVFN